MFHRAKTLLHTETFTRRRICAHKLLHTDAFTHRRFYTQTLLHTDTLDTQKYHFIKFWTVEPHFVRKGCAGPVKIAILPQFLAIEARFVRKGCDRHFKIAILPQFLAIEPHFVRISFRANGLRPTLQNCNFTSVFGDRSSFRAKRLRFVPSRWHCPVP